VEEIEAKYSMLQGQLKTLQAEKVTSNSSEQGLQAKMDALLAEQATKDAQMRKSAYVLQQENEAVAGKLQTLAKENTKYKELVDEYLEIGSQAEQELESLTTHSEVLHTNSYIHTYMYTCMHAYVYMCIYTRIYVPCMHACRYIYIYVYAYIHIYITCIFIYIRKYTYT